MPQERQKTAGYLLVGGRSRRMGSDKALMLLGNRPMASVIAEHVSAAAGSVTLVGSNAKYAQLGWPVIEDIEPGGLGPVGGIRTALEHSGAEWNLVVGCDLPFLTTEFLRYLLQRATAADPQVVVPVSDAGVLEAVCAVYRRDCLEAFRAARRSRLASVIGELRRLEITPSEWRPFDATGNLLHNVNTLTDWELARRLHG